MDSGLYGFIAFIGVVATILNIILFFKVWGMTNNVKGLTKIAQKFTNIGYLSEQDVLVKQDEFKKLWDERERIQTDPNADFNKRSSLVKEIDEKIKDTYL
ncbi:hypothetical protein N9333_01095 [Gammaproteobacteria bacterium]|nr:hypothetical protein [Gammaproteobacteria bacterium]